MINSVDMNNDGVLSFCEFVKLMSRQHNPFITPKEQFESVFRSLFYASHLINSYYYIYCLRFV